MCVHLEERPNAMETKKHTNTQLLYMHMHHNKVVNTFDADAWRIAWCSTAWRTMSTFHALSSLLASRHRLAYTITYTYTYIRLH